MIDVGRYWGWAMVLAAVAGMIGGLVYDLVIDRLGDSGVIEKIAQLTSDDQKRRYVDIGTWASVIVGGVAAVGFLFFLTPEVRTVLIAATKETAESSRTIREYNPFKLVPASLIVGTGGVSFVKAMRERLLKLVNETKLAALSAAVADQTQKIEEAMGGNANMAQDQAAEAQGRLGALRDLAHQLSP